MKAIETVKMSRGGKVQITSKAREKLGWNPGEILVEMTNDAEDALVLMREGDVSVEKKRGNNEYTAEEGK